MSTEIIHQITEEEWEYKQRNAELNSLEIQLAQQELELATFRGELQSFRLRYFNVVGMRYMELDKLEAELAEIMAQLKPNDKIARQKAEQAKEQAKESEKAARSQDRTGKRSSKFKPTESLKKLYRRIAKLIHPDLAVDDQERARYQRLMARANQAYQAGDEIGLQNILRQWKNNSTGEKNDSLPDKLARIIRQITQVKERLVAIERELAEIQSSSLYQLKLKVEAADANGCDLLLEMARYLDEQIFITKNKIAHLREKGVEPLVG